MPVNKLFSKLWSPLASSISLVLNKFAPDWASNKIDGLLFIPKTVHKKPVRLPKDLEQCKIKTPDGTIIAYKTGKGPTVVFIHGWGGGGYQFFPLMRGLSQCGFTAFSFDHLGHLQSDEKPATLQQSITTTNFVLDMVRKKPGEGLCALVGHSTGCIAIASARQVLIKDIPLFLISPIFDYKRYFIKKLVSLKLHADLVKKHASRFSKAYKSEYEKFELAQNLERYSEVCVIAHDDSDQESPVKDSVNFCMRFPLTKLLVTKEYDHTRIINSESVWHELKTHLNYDDTTINFAEKILNK